MGQVKAKTLLEKMGFVDEDRKSPDHQKIQEWTYKNVHLLIDSLFAKSEWTFQILSNEWEYEVYSTSYNSRSIVGFVDIAVKFEKDNDKREWDDERPRVFFEIKTKILSFGDLLRQLKVYRTYLTHKKQAFVVVCPDDSYADLLKEQGFFFYKYQDPEKLF
jgi:hypothetical protein